MCLTNDTDQRETNTTRLTAILNDAALRLLYREFLRETLCEENLAFYLDVEEFNHNFHAIDLTKSDAVRETLAAAYGMSHQKMTPFVHPSGCTSHSTTENLAFETFS